MARLVPEPDTIVCRDDLPRDRVVHIHVAGPGVDRELMRYARCRISVLLPPAATKHVAHYDFCCRHTALRITLSMAANLSRTLWSLEDLHDQSMR
jgi:hypothetical protein